ncbi:MAG: hypothetical protein IPK82_20125 [Polyangiaceae bacterium]|nr:hypothetical protein [Polyangiaceae bacterium]
MKTDAKHYGLPIYEVDGEEYAVGTEEQAENAVKLAIVDSIWAFKPEFLTTFLRRHMPHVRRFPAKDLEKALRVAQEKLSEDAAALIWALVGTLIDTFEQAVVAADGRGHFLSPYDGKERRSDTVPGLPEGRVAYRLN